jgi:hypothetical protein
VAGELGPPSESRAHVSRFPADEAGESRATQYSTAVNPLVVVGIMVVAVAVVLGLLYLVRSVEPADGLLRDVGRANALGSLEPRGNGG